MNYKNNLHIKRVIISLFILIFFTVPHISCAIFNTTCNTNTITDENLNKPVIISVFSDGKIPLPKEFNIKIVFDNDIFKKNAKINYNTEISKNYKHNKNIFGNEISVSCSLKNNKTAPIIPKNQELFSLIIECKKSITKSDTDLTVTAEGDYGIENTHIPIKIQLSSMNTPTLSKLTPEIGNLSPDFNPNINEYSLTVPYDTQNLNFQTETDDNYTVKISRHKLQSPGSVTDIYVTVKPSQKGMQTTYHISVNREDAPEKSKKERSSKEKTIHRKLFSMFSKKGEKYDCPETSSESQEKSPEFKTLEIKKSENSANNNQKLYSIIILSSVIVISALYILINRKKIFKNKISLNKTSEK